MLKRYTHNEAWEEQAIVDDLSFSVLDKFIETDHVNGLVSSSNPPPVQYPQLQTSQSYPAPANS